MVKGIPAHLSSPDRDTQSCTPPFSQMVLSSHRTYLALVITQYWTWESEMLTYFQNMAITLRISVAVLALEKVNRQYGGGGDTSQEFSLSAPVTYRSVSTLTIHQH